MRRKPSKVDVAETGHCSTPHNWSLASRDRARPQARTLDERLSEIRGEYARPSHPLSASARRPWSPYGSGIRTADPFAATAAHDTCGGSVPEKPPWSHDRRRVRVRHSSPHEPGIRDRRVQVRRCRPASAGPASGVCSRSKRRTDRWPRRRRRMTGSDRLWLGRDRGGVTLNR